MNQKWNLQDIRPSEARKKTTRKKASTQASISSPRASKEPKNKKRYWIIAGFAFLGIFIMFIIGNLTYKAEVYIEPKHRLTTINATMQAAVQQTSNNTLPYEVMRVSATAEREVTPTGESEVEEKASGTIEISNRTSQPQRLVASTRFETDDNKVYRVEEAIVIPAGSEDGPGTYEVEVVADEVGESYNISSGAELTIPGFAENNYTELFEMITATVKEDFTGGFSGVRYEVAEDELRSVQETMRSELREALLQKLEADKPADFILFEDAILISYESIPPTEKTDDSDAVRVQESAVLEIPLFNQADFASHIAGQAVAGYEGEGVRVDNWEELDFSFATSTPNIANEFSFTLRGDAQLVWTFDHQAFKAELAGEQHAALRFIIPEYSAIKGGNAAIRPIWKRSYPTDTEKIILIEELSW